MGLKRIAKNALGKIISQSVDFNPESNFMIFGDPRGGTTWLTESLLHIPKTVMLWEPLHLDYNPRLRKIGFDWRQHIPKDSYWPEAHLEISKILHGKTINSFTSYNTRLIDYLKAEHLLIKFCRGTALLPWICEHFRFRYKPIYLIRHPFAVAASQLNKGAWNFPFEQFQIPETRYSEMYQQHFDFLKTIRSREESLVATWCLTNSIPLNSTEPKNWIEVHYEKLFTNPQREMTRIFGEWNIPLTEKIIEQLEYASSTTKTPIIDQLNKWRVYFEDDQIDRFVEILDYFKITSYSREILPM